MNAPAAHNRGVSLSIHTMLGVALEAARSALRELDADQVPNDLRKVAGYAGTLPPPLAKSLVKGLEQYEWLRDKAVEQLPESAVGERAEAAAVYLRRPVGWELRLVEIATAMAGAAGKEAAQAAVAKGREQAAALQAVKAKAKAVQRELSTRNADLERRLTGLAAQRKAKAAGEARGERHIDRAVDDLRLQSDRLREERDAARREAKEIREAFRVERALRRKVESDAAAGAPTGVWDESPGGLADRLDQMERMARPAAVPRAIDGAAPIAGVRLPKGVAPDARTAIDWMLGRESAATVIVDGYNVGYLMQGDNSPGPARTRVAPLLAHLHKMARGTLKVMVVYDSDMGPAETRLVPGPVAVRYSRGDETADDEIVRLAGSLNGPVFVISDDREVRERSEAKGAIPLWSRSLLEWAATR